MNPDPSDPTPHVDINISAPTLPLVPIGPPQPRQSRVTLITKLYYQPYGIEATAPKSVPYEEMLTTEEQAYHRRLKVGEEWVPIDFGWTAESGCSFLYVVNEYKVRRRITPSPEDRKEELMHVLEIGKAIKGVNLLIDKKVIDGGEYVEPFCVLYVGQPIPLSPLGQAQYRIRSRYGEGHYSVFCVPADADSM